MGWLVAYAVVGTLLGLMSYGGMRRDNKSQSKSVIAGVLMATGWLPLMVVVIIGLALFRGLWRTWY